MTVSRFVQCIPVCVCVRVCVCVCECVYIARLDQMLRCETPKKIEVCVSVLVETTGTVIGQLGLVVFPPYKWRQDNATSGNPQ